MVRSLLFAVGAFIISNVGTAAMDWLKQLSITPMQSGVVSTGIGLAVVFLTVVLDTFKEPKPAVAGTVYSGRAPAPVYQQQPSGYYYQQQQPPPPVYQQPQRPPKPQRRVPWIVAVVLILGLCGVGGFAVTWGVQWANGMAICKFDPKHYDGVDRLAGQAVGSSGRLAIEVTRVMVSKCGTVVTVHAVNGGDSAVHLPIYKNASLTVPGRTSPGGDPFTSDWNETVPAGGQMTGILVFRSIPDDTASITLSFATIFGRLDGPQGISVEIPLSVVSES